MTTHTQGIEEHEFDLMVSQYEELFTNHFHTQDNPFELDYEYSQPDNLAFNNGNQLIFVTERPKLETVTITSVDLITHEQKEIPLYAFSKSQLIQ